MKKRIISGIIMAAVVIPVLYFGGVVFDIAMAALSVMAFKELVDVRSSAKLPTLLKMVALVLMLMLTFDNIDGHTLGLGINYKTITLVFLLLLIPTLFLRKQKYHIEDAFYLAAITIFIGVTFNLFIMVYNASVIKFIWLIVIACATDIFALFGGRLIGRHKLTTISPKKTVEGSIVGTVVSIIISTTYYVTLVGTENIGVVIAIELLLSVMGQMGDLFFSLIKRENDVKDFSNLIPGHGGILDRIDSIIFIVITFVFCNEILIGGILDEKEKQEEKVVKKKKVDEKVEKVEKTQKEESLVKNLIELAVIVAVIVVILAFFPNTFMWNIVVLLLILSALIFVHEFGHFIMAKTFKVHVYEFALGMGPKVLGFKRKNDPTDYTLRALPIGGYCAMAGEEGEDDKTLEKDKFLCNKPKWQRVIILCAGVVMNFITAIVLLFLIAFIWGSTDQSNRIGVVTEDSPAAVAGIVPGDRIIALNGHKINNWDKMTVVANFKNESETYKYTILHEDGKTSTYTLKPDTYVIVEDKMIKVTEEHTMEEILKENKIDKDDAKIKKMIGIGASTKKKYGFVNSLKYAFYKFGSLISMLFLILGSLFTGKLGLNALSGPVGMYSVVGEVATYGIANIIYLMAYLSVNLGVINILPFPAFDGGRIVFVLIEAITRKKVDAKVEAAFHSVGFIILMLLMLYITFQDILRLF